MDLRERIESFARLGESLREVLDDSHNTNAKTGHEMTHLKILIDNQFKLNPWFTSDNVRMALKSIADELTIENLIRWTDNYPDLKTEREACKVGVIMAGNIPMVGFHDYLSVLISGNNLIAKTSSKDHELIAYISDLLCSINAKFRDRIVFVTDTLMGFDSVIATGSDNSSRYFEYYFGRYPNIIRKNRNSIAIIEGDETEDELRDLGKDIFSYFGLGCRNVSKLYLPKGYDPVTLTNRWGNFEGVISNSKYANNYDFNKAVYIVNKEPFHDSGYLLLKEDKRISSPVSVLYYEHYESQDAVRQQTETLKEKIQCIVGKSYIPFGKAQSPHFWDYADGIDTIEFLLKKKIARIL